MTNFEPTIGLGKKGSKKSAYLLPRLLWVGPLRLKGGINTVTDRFLADPEVHKRYNVRVQEQGIYGKWNEVDFLRPSKIPVGIIMIVWNILTFKPDLIHIHSSYQRGFLRDGLMALVAKALRVKVVMTFHPGFKETLEENYFEGAAWFKWLTRLVIRNIDGVIVHGPTYQRFIQSEFGNIQSHILVNPVPDDVVPEEIPDYSGRENVVLFVGSFDRRKGLIEILQAAEFVPNARFVFRGQAFTRKDKVELQKAYDRCPVKNRIYFDVGWEIDKVFEYMKRARLLVLPSWGETLPVVIEEAMAFGLPIVTTPVGVITDYVKDGENGYIVPPGNIHKLADAINRILENEALAVKMSNNNRNVAKQFLVSVVHPQLLNIYDTLLEIPVNENLRSRRISIGIDASNLRGGGGATHLVELLRAAQPNKHGFTDITVWGGNSILTMIEDRPWLHKIHERMLDMPLLIRNQWQRFILDKKAREERCNILFIPGGTRYGSFRPFVTMCQNMLPFERQEAHRFGFSWLAIKFILLRKSHLTAFRKADGLIFLSEYSRKVVSPLIVGTTAQKTLIPHGVDKRFFQEPKHQRQLSTYSAESPFRLLYVSQIAPYKHQWNVMEAVYQLRQMGLPLELELVGSIDHSGKRFHQALARYDPKGEWIKYQGEIPFSAIHESYKNADLFVFASSCENFSIVLMEAMASGLPIASSICGPMPSVLGKTAVYFDPEKPNEIANAIKVLIDDPKLREEKSWAAHELVKQFTWQHCAELTFEFLAEVEQIGYLNETEVNP